MKNNIDLDKFIEMSKKIYVNPSDEVINSLKEDFNCLIASLELLNSIDIANVEPLYRIGGPISDLREDLEDDSILLDKKVMLNNAKDKDDDFVIIKRVIK